MNVHWVDHELASHRTNCTTTDIDNSNSNAMSIWLKQRWKHWHSFFFYLSLQYHWCLYLRFSSLSRARHNTKNVYAAYQICASHFYLFCFGWMFSLLLSLCVSVCLFVCQQNNGRKRIPTGFMEKRERAIQWRKKWGERERKVECAAPERPFILRIMTLGMVWMSRANRERRKHKIGTNESERKMKSSEKSDNTHTHTHFQAAEKKN